MVVIVKVKYDSFFGLVIGFTHCASTRQNFFIKSAGEFEDARVKNAVLIVYTNHVLGTCISEYLSCKF
jgi:hypothetical protein